MCAKSDAYILSFYFKHHSTHYSYVTQVMLALENLGTMKVEASVPCTEHEERSTEHQSKGTRKIVVYLGCGPTFVNSFTANFLYTAA